MKLALICTEKLPVPPVKGGAIQTYIDGVLPYLAARHDVTVICRTDAGLPDHEVVPYRTPADADTAPGEPAVRFIRVDPANYAQNVARVLAMEAWDAVEVFNRPAYVPTLTAAAPGARFILSMHNDMFQPHRLPADVARSVLERVEAVVTISDYVGREIGGLYPEFASKLTTIRSGVDLKRFHTGPRCPVLEARHGLAGRPVILAVGRISAKKGTHILVDAMAEVRHQQPDAVMLVVGARWYGENDLDDYGHEVKARAALLGDAVRFTGYAPYPQIPDIFRLGDLFVCGSQWQEPLARVHYEAMATGLPIITTARGGNSEVVQNGHNGLLIHQHDDPSAFAAAICTLLADSTLRRTMGQRGRLWAERAHSWAHVASSLLAVLEGR